MGVQSQIKPEQNKSTVSQIYYMQAIEGGGNFKWEDGGKDGSWGIEMGKWQENSKGGKAKHFQISTAGIHSHSLYQNNHALGCLKTITWCL